MAKFIVDMEQVEYKEYDLVVEAESIESIKEQWDEISSVVNDYCSFHDTEGLDDDGTIVGTEIKVVFGTEESKDQWIDVEKVSVVWEGDDEDEDEDE